MTTRVAFLGHSFSDEDRFLVEKVRAALQELQIEVLTGERAAETGVAQKVRERLERAVIFVGLFTRRHKIAGTSAYTTSAWVVEEKGYFLGRGVSRQVVILVEEKIEVPAETGGIGGDLEYFHFNRYDFDPAIEKLREALRPRD